MDNKPSMGTRSNRCLIDAFTCTMINITPETLVKDILKLDASLWQRCDYGRYGYRKSLQFGTIKIYYDGKTDSMGICLEMTGQGCLELVQLTHNDSIFYDIISNPIASSTRLTRIDIAVDDFMSFLNMDIIVDKVEHRELRTKLQAKTECKGLADTDGHTIYIGSASSNTRIRIYDKQAQMETDYSWIRVEMVLRHSMAQSFQSLILDVLNPFVENCNHEIAKLGVAVLRDKLSFVEIDDSNRSRCSVCDWWQDFLDTAPIHISIDRQRIPAIEQATEWLRKQVFPTLTLLLCLLGPAWFDWLLGHGAEHLDTTRAVTWLQQMYAMGMGVNIDPLSEDLIESIRCMLGDYYQHSQ